MSDDDRRQQMCRYWLWAIALLHFVCLLLIKRAPDPQVVVNVPTHYASTASDLPATPRT